MRNPLFLNRVKTWYFASPLKKCMCLRVLAWTFSNWYVALFSPPLPLANDSHPLFSGPFRTLDGGPLSFLFPFQEEQLSGSLSSSTYGNGSKSSPLCHAQSSIISLFFFPSHLFSRSLKIRTFQRLRELRAVSLFCPRDDNVCCWFFPAYLFSVPSKDRLPLFFLTLLSPFFSISQLPFFFFFVLYYTVLPSLCRRNSRFILPRVLIAQTFQPWSQSFRFLHSTALWLESLFYKDMPPHPLLVYDPPNRPQTSSVSFFPPLPSLRKKPQPNLPFVH